MDKRIIKIEPVKQEIKVGWMLSRYCNYDCMYCPSAYHDKDISTLYSLETLKEKWQSFYCKTEHLNLPYKIDITGGEPTANKNFLPFIDWLKQNYQLVKDIIVTSNGSASVNYYKKLSKYIDNLSLSFHGEFTDEAEFFSKSQELSTYFRSTGKYFHVNVMNESWNLERVKLFSKYLDQHNINYSINNLDESLGTRNTVLQKGVINIEQIL
jgi:MoaA/NifB/PqqE/SkfB family radical SAM enzyme